MMTTPEMGAMVVGIWIGAILVTFLFWSLGVPEGWCG
jgi:hypothetical protein